MYPRPDIYAHPLTKLQTALVRLAAAVLGLLALACALVLAFKPWTLPDPNLLIVGGLAIIGGLAVAFAIPLWRKRPGAIVLLTFVMLVVAMASVVTGLYGLYEPNWTNALMGGAIFGACLIYLNAFLRLCLKK